MNHECAERDPAGLGLCVLCDSEEYSWITRLISARKVK